MSFKNCSFVSKIKLCTIITQDDQLIYMVHGQNLQILENLLNHIKALDQAAWIHMLILILKWGYVIKTFFSVIAQSTLSVLLTKSNNYSNEEDPDKKYKLCCHFIRIYTVCTIQPLLLVAVTPAPNDGIV